MHAPVAQGIEQGLPKPRVGGSIPPRRVFNLWASGHCSITFLVSPVPGGAHWGERETNRTVRENLTVKNRSNFGCTDSVSGK